MSSVNTLAMLSAIVIVVACAVAVAPADLGIVTVPPYVRSVRFHDPMHGWITGYRGVFYTEDGGRNWRKLDVQIGAVAWYKGGRQGTGVILLADDQRVMVRGDTAVWLGGASGQWKSRNLGHVADTFKVLAFADWEHGFAAEPFGTICRTSDGGKTWGTVRQGGRLAWLRSLCLQPGGGVWAVGNRLVLRSRDRGRTWATVLAGDEDYVSAHFPNRSIGWLGAKEGRIYTTSDGGDSWTVQGGRFPGWLDMLTSIDGIEGWAAGSDPEKTPPNSVTGDKRIFHTRDGGAHWSLCTVPVEDYFLDIQTIGSGEAWVVGRSGAVLHTRDHGQTWTSVVLPW